MKMRLFCAILAICSVVFFKVVADERDYALLKEIVAIDETCIQGCIDDKIYLNPDKIVSAGHSLFLSLGDENYLPIPTIYSDAVGYYITPVVSIYSKCPHCGRDYIIKCTNVNCPGKKKTK